MLAPLVVSIAYGEWIDTLWLTISSAITVALGVVVWHSFRQAKDLSLVQAFGAVGLAWLVMVLAASRRRRRIGAEASRS